MRRLSPNWGRSVPTDSYYADLSLSDAESWDLDGDTYYGEHGDDAPDFLADTGETWTRSGPIRRNSSGL